MYWSLSSSGVVCSIIFLSFQENQMSSITMVWIKLKVEKQQNSVDILQVVHRTTSISSFAFVGIRFWYKPEIRIYLFFKWKDNMVAQQPGASAASFETQVKTVPTSPTSSPFSICLLRNRRRSLVFSRQKTSAGDHS